MAGDWRREHRRNNLNLYLIEPLCESMLQVYVQFTIIYVVEGPGVGYSNGELII